MILSKGSLCGICKIFKIGPAAYHKSLWSGLVFEVPLTGLTDHTAMSLRDRGVSVVSVNQEWQRLIPTSSVNLDYPYN